MKPVLKIHYPDAKNSAEQISLDLAIAELSKNFNVEEYNEIGLPRPKRPN